MPKKFFRVLRRQDITNSTLMNIATREGESTGQTVPLCLYILCFLPKNQKNTSRHPRGACVVLPSFQPCFTTNNQNKQGFSWRQGVGSLGGDDFFNLKREKHQFSCPAHLHTTSGCQHPRLQWACCARPLLLGRLKNTVSYYHYGC